jgi:hypothetical protein
MRNVVKKRPHGSNSSNFDAVFFVNEYYNASAKGIKNLMDFYKFLLYVMGNIQLQNVTRGAEGRGRNTAGCQMTC